MKGAIVFGGHIQGLGIMRLLGMNNIPVFLLDHRTLNIARFSKYCKRFIKIPESVYNDTNFVSFMNKLYEDYDIEEWILFATDDLVTGLISRNRNELSKRFSIWNQEWDIVKICLNKKYTYEIAEKLSIPYPKSIFPNSVNDLSNFKDPLKYPLIIKPAIMQSFYKKTRQKVFKVKNYEDLLEKYNYTCKIIDPSEIIIQEIIPGSPQHLYSYGCFHNIDHSEGHVIGRRRRQIPMDFGKGSTFVELCNIPQISEYSLKFLNAIRYYGLSEVEFKYDERDDTYKLLEINPRAWRWHTIAYGAGLNLPYKLYNNVYQIDKVINECYNMTNVKWMDLYGDIYIGTSEVLKGNISIKDYITSLKGHLCFEVLDKNDILPFIAETILLPLIYIQR